MYEILVFDLPYLNVCLLEFTARMLCSFVLKILKLHAFLEHNLLLNSTVRKINTYARRVKNERSERVRCRVEREKRNSISTSNHLLFCVSYKHNSPLLGRKADFIDE